MHSAMSRRPAGHGSARQPGGSVAPAPAAKPDVVVEGSKLVCRRETVIGSNIPGKRVCKPKSEIAAEQLAGRDEAQGLCGPVGASSNNSSLSDVTQAPSVAFDPLRTLTSL